MNLKEINEKFERTKKQLVELDMEYMTKEKGNAYIKRKSQLINKMGSLKQKALETGTTGVICHVSGKLSRPSKRNPNIQVTEKFNLYFTNVTENEAAVLVRLHVKNVISYTTTFFKPGILMTTS